jgi:natural product biosynthesis luciferase-like monooxygenase protein
MDDIAKRLAALTTEQRELLELRLRKKGLQSPLAQSAGTLTVEGAAQGVRVPETDEAPANWRERPVERPVSFSLYFFSDDGSKNSEDKYRLLLESAKFADHHGFSAVWTPERHFQAFGGLYPNPSVLSAALSMITERVQIRAGSVALPLHHPVRVAEEWSVVDNLSQGRVAVSFASGWHPNDFLFAPDAYEQRKDVMFSHIEIIRRLWAGEAVTFQGTGENTVEVSILPKPIQPQLPMWITTAGSPATWVKAGEIGANILTGLAGYLPEDLKALIQSYREARAKNNHDPQTGVVSVMVHTFVGEDTQAVKEKVRQPLSNYLMTYFKQFEKVQYDPESVSEADKKDLMAAAFENYFLNSTLLGSPAKCARLIEKLTGLGIDEVACLVDFGVETDSVIESLALLNELREHFDPQAPMQEPSAAGGVNE